MPAVGSVGAHGAVVDAARQTQAAAGLPWSRGIAKTLVVELGIEVALAARGACRDGDRPRHRQDEAQSHHDVNCGSNPHGDEGDRFDL